MSLTLLNAVTAIGPGTGVQLVNIQSNSFQLAVTAAPGKTFKATVNIEQSANNSTWTIVKSFVVSGDIVVQDSYSAIIPSNYYVRGNLVSSSGFPSVTLVDNTVAIPPVSIDTSGNLVKQSYTIATLPAAPLTGTSAYVTNGQTSPTFLGAVSTTGTTVAPVFYNGTGWVYG